MDWGLIGFMGGMIGFVLSIFLAGFGVLWSRISSLESKMDSMRTDLHHEFRDFHGRLTAIEARAKGVPLEEIEPLVRKALQPKTLST